MPYKFIYFDLDDTLLDHKSAELAGLNEVHQQFPLFDSVELDKLAQIYHEVNCEQWTLYSHGDITREQLQRNRFEKTLVRLGLKRSHYKEVGDFYLQSYQNHWRWMKGAEEAYQTVSADYRLGILTNGFTETQQKKIKQFNFHGSAECIVISEEVGALKPDPKVFQHATDLAGVKAEEILYVGNSFNTDIKGGTAFGWRTAWFTESGDTEQRQQADFVFDDFNDLVELLNVN